MWGIKWFQKCCKSAPVVQWRSMVWDRISMMWDVMHLNNCRLTCWLDQIWPWGIHSNVGDKKSSVLLYDEFIWEIWVISETWLDCSKLTYHTCNSTNKGPKNGSITFKGHKAVLLKAILAKTSNFWPIGPIELKFWHLILKIIHFNISLRRSHGSSFRPLWWLYLGP